MEERQNRQANAFVDLIVHYCRNKELDENYQVAGSTLRHFLDREQLPAVEGGEYIRLETGLINSINSFLEGVKNKKQVSGNVLWKMVKSVSRQVVEDRRVQGRFQKDMFRILSLLNLEPSAKDKINFLDFINFRYKTPEFRAAYDMAGAFKIGENPDDFDYERQHTVKVFGELLREAKKSTGKDKIVSARAFLETVAANGDLLDGVVYEEGDERFEIDKQARLQMKKYMEKSKDIFSESCLSYFSEGNTLPQPPGRALLDKPIKDYAVLLFDYASRHFENENIRTDALEKLLLENAEFKNKRKKNESLFPELVTDKELIKIDKNLLQDIAEKYASSFSISDWQAEEFNSDFHKRMTGMLLRLTQQAKYTTAEKEKLCQAMRAHNSDKEIACMCHAIMIAGENGGVPFSKNAGLDRR